MQRRTRMFPGAWQRGPDRRGGDRGGPDLAAEPWLPARWTCCGAQAGERTLDVCAAPGGKTTMLDGEVVAVEVIVGRARERDEVVEPVGATNVAWSSPTAETLPASRRLRPRARGRAVLRSRDADSRPDLRWRAEPVPAPARAARSRGERVRPEGTIVYAVCTINADESEEIVEAVRAARSCCSPRSATSGPRFRHPRRAGVPADVPARARHVRLLHRPAAPAVAPSPPATTPGRRVRTAVRSRHGVAGVDPDDTEIEPSLYAADFLHLGDQVQALLNAGARIFHVDVGDGRFIPPVTIGPVIVQALSHRRSIASVAGSTAT